MKLLCRATPLAIAAALGLVAGASGAPGDFARAMHESMARMMAGMERAGMSGDPDRDFLAMMIPHHQGAVDMARLELLHGRDPLVRRLAEEIIASQTAEIEAMRARLAILEKHEDFAPGGFPVPYGTRGRIRR